MRLKKEISDVKILQNVKAEQVVKMERILQRPLIVVPHFEHEAREGKDDGVDGCIFDQSQTNTSPKTMQSRDKHGGDQSTGKQEQRKFAKKFDVPTISATLKGKLVEGQYNAADDKDDFIDSKVEKQKTNVSRKDVSDSCCALVCVEVNGGSNLCDISSDDISVVRSLTKGHKRIMTDNKVDIQAFPHHDNCLLITKEFTNFVPREKRNWKYLSLRNVIQQVAPVKCPKGIVDMCKMNSTRLKMSKRIYGLNSLRCAKCEI